jgi:hypothetical protein
VFAYRKVAPMRNRAQMTVRAADIAERIVEEISQSGQDWGAIARHARELVELIERRGDRQARPA